LLCISSVDGIVAWSAARERLPGQASAYEAVRQADLPLAGDGTPWHVNNERRSLHVASLMGADPSISSMGHVEWQRTPYLLR
jgi:hypothetical protein